MRLLQTDIIRGTPKLTVFCFYCHILFCILLPPKVLRLFIRKGSFCAQPRQQGKRCFSINGINSLWLATIFMYPKTVTQPWVRDKGWTVQGYRFRNFPVFSFMVYEELGECGFQSNIMIWKLQMKRKLRRELWDKILVKKTNRREWSTW